MAVSATPDDENPDPLPRSPPARGRVGAGVRRARTLSVYYGYYDINSIDRNKSINKNGSIYAI